ncbi:Uma2 family endonuclease [Lentzea sp. NPDC051838]|uniref:Uma2 family endonuclease n=1 Tax=Lentzea sp. NPDC051838 TaxID=3154849 RepID=UPI00343B336D
MIITLADYDAMTEDTCRRHELVDGELVEMPPRYPRHQHALMKLLCQLDEQLPAGLDVLHSFDVLLRDDKWPMMRKPDVVVARVEAFRDDVTRFDAEDVVLVAEVLQEESEDVDLRVKLREYAAAGIPNYWIVAPDDPVSMAAYSLVDGRYALAAGGTGMLDVVDPVPMSLDLDALIRRR